MSSRVAAQAAAIWLFCQRGISALLNAFRCRDPRPPSSRKMAFMLGPGTRLVGHCRFQEGTALIEGLLEGPLEGTPVCSAVVGKAAVVAGNVAAGWIEIAGTIRGDVIAAESVKLSATARVYGDIHCRLLSMPYGAIVTGRVVQYAAATGIPNETANGREINNPPSLNAAAGAAQTSDGMPFPEGPVSAELSLAPEWEPQEAREREIELRRSWLESISAIDDSELTLAPDVADGAGQGAGIQPDQATVTRIDSGSALDPSSTGSIQRLPAAGDATPSADLAELPAGTTPLLSSDMMAIAQAFLRPRSGDSSTRQEGSTLAQ
jgi:cytoskeletal protein CcmA (bactofilin family)